MSAITESIQVGITHDDRGVPLGLVNWMVLNRARCVIPTCRVVNRIGYLWFIIRLAHLKMNLLVWEDA